MKIVRLNRPSALALKQVNDLLRQLSKKARVHTSASLKSVLADPKLELWVLRNGSHIVGMGALLFISIPTAFYACIEDVVVDAGYRGRGLGKKLMRHLIVRAKKRKARFVGLTSNPSRIAANKLYKKLGFKLRKTNSYRMEL